MFGLKGGDILGSNQILRSAKLLHSKTHIQTPLMTRRKKKQAKQNVNCQITLSSSEELTKSRKFDPEGSKCPSLLPDMASWLLKFRYNTGIPEITLN